MNINPKLKPCPACGAQAELWSEVYVECSSDGCNLIGPKNDPTGAKWNALPRRCEAQPVPTKLADVLVTIDYWLNNAKESPDRESFEAIRAAVAALLLIDKLKEAK